MDIHTLATWVIRSLPSTRWWYSGQDRKDVVKIIKDLEKEWDIEWLYQKQRDLILENSSVKKDLYNAIAFNTWIDQISSALKAFKAWWEKNTWYFRSIAEKTANYFWTTTDTELAKSNNNIWLFVADYIRAISWTAAADKERENLISLMPNIKNTDELNKMLTVNLRDRNNELARAKVDFTLWSKKVVWPKLFQEFYEQSWTDKTDILSGDLERFNKIKSKTWTLKDDDMNDINNIFN